MAPDEHGRVDDLQRAMSIYIAEFVDGGASADEVLARHPDLEELLEPLLLDGEGDAPDDIGAADEPAPGRVIGDYRLVRELGRGGMGVVWEARQISLDRPVALKLLPADQSADARALVRFQREAAAAAGLDHPGIVRVHQTGRAGDVQFIAMDFVIGTPLDQIVNSLKATTSVEPRPAPTAEQLNSAIHSGHRAPADTQTSEAPGPTLRGSYVANVVSIVADVADALEHAHRANVIHRDVKPANILVRPDNRAVLTDFGIAQRTGQLGLTHTGDVPGTPYYLAPERIRKDAREADGRSDVFALGVTLYELLTLRRPFDGDSPAQVMHRLLNAEPEDPQRVNPALPPDLTAIVLMTLEKDPARRYQTAGDLAADLRAFLEHRPVHARRPTTWRRARRWVRREPWQAALAAVVIVGTLGFAVALGHWWAKQPQLIAGERALTEQRLEEHLVAGLFELDSGIADKADAAFRSALALDPSSVEAIAGLVLVAERVGGPTAGLEALETLSDVAAEAGALRRLRAGLLRDTGDEAGADAIAADLRAAESPIELFVQGVHAIRRGHGGDSAAFFSAVDDLEQAILASPHARPAYHFEWAHAIGHTGLREKAKLSRAITDQWPDSWRAWFWRSFAHSGQPRARLRLLEQGTERLPEVAYLWRLLGQGQSDLGDRVAARASFERACDATPDDPAPHYDLAQVLRALGETALATEQEERCIALDPEHSASLTVLANRAFDAGDRDAAEPLYQSAYELGAPGPVRGLAVFRLGVLRGMRDDVRGAAEAFQLALADLDGWPPLHNNLANVLHQLDDLDAAEIHARRALSLRPNLALAHFNLATVLSKKTDWSALHTAARTWLERAPGDSRPHYYIALALWGLAADDLDPVLEDALAAAERCVTLAKSASAENFALLARIQSRLGRHEDAIRTLDRALEVANDAQRPTLEASQRYSREQLDREPKKRRG